MASQPTPRTLQPPPDLPSMPDVSNTLTGYLRNFALWCRHGFADKISGSTAQPGFMLMAYDAPSGTAPPTFMLRVNSAGTLSATPIMMGGANPALSGRTRSQTQTPGLGDPIIIGGNSTITSVFIQQTRGLIPPCAMAAFCGSIRLTAIAIQSLAQLRLTTGLQIPTGLDGVYIINGWSSTHANQATTMGMGIMVNGARTFSETNQAIYGPNSVDYIRRQFRRFDPAPEGWR